MRQFSCLVTRLPVAFALVVGVVTATTVGFSKPASARTVAVIPPEGVVSGPARVIDGDTIDIAGTRIRLEGIDAPEAAQSCQTADGTPWPCGTLATREMRRMTEGQSVDCYSRGLDKYDRLLAACFVGALDVNGAMVRRGYAWAFIRYSQRYVTLEALARDDGIGIWQGPALPAWEYRAQRWTTAVQQAAPDGCAIKGNVSNAGHVYHMPWSQWYAKVSMSVDKGKRWFCSEAEAQAAGWRPAGSRPDVTHSSADTAISTH